MMIIILAPRSKVDEHWIEKESHAPKFQHYFTVVHVQADTTDTVNPLPQMHACLVGMPCTRSCGSIPKHAQQFTDLLHTGQCSTTQSQFYFIFTSINQSINHYIYFIIVFHGILYKYIYNSKMEKTKT